MPFRAVKYIKNIKKGKRWFGAYFSVLHIKGRYVKRYAKIVFPVCYNILVGWYNKKKIFVRERYDLGDIVNAGKSIDKGIDKGTNKSVVGFVGGKDRHGKAYVQRSMRIKGQSKGGGRCVKFTPEQLLEAFSKYKKECIKKDNVMTINGFGLSAGFVKDTLLSYRKEHRGYAEALNIIDAEMLESVVQKGYKMRNPAFAIFHLKNSFGWKDHEDTNVNVVNVIQQMDSDDRRARIRELLRQKESFAQITGSVGEDSVEVEYSVSEDTSGDVSGNASGKVKEREKER